MVKTKTEQRQTLTAKRRAVQGTRPVKRLRQDGVVPGVVYGKQMEPVAVTIDQRELVKLLHSKMGEHALVTLRIDDGKPWEKPVLVKAIQHDPVDGRVVHVDFHAIALTERLKVKVPVALKGDAVGVKQEGGILEHFLREVEVECLPTEIPEGVEVDVAEALHDPAGGRQLAVNGLAGALLGGWGHETELNYCVAMRCTTRRPSRPTLRPME